MEPRSSTSRTSVLTSLLPQISEICCGAKRSFVFLTGGPLTWRFLQRFLQREGAKEPFIGCGLCCVQVQQLQGVYNLQEPHFWTLCSDVYIGTLKLLVAPDADTRWILSQTHNIFTQVGGGLQPPRTSPRPRRRRAGVKPSLLCAGWSPSAVRPDGNGRHVEAPPR